MNERQRHALILELIDRLNMQGSWCGPEYLQKAVYFLQHLLQVPTGLDFVLYMFAPFSFDLEDEETTMRADYLLEWRLRSGFFGPILWPTEGSKAFRERYPITLKTYDDHLAFVCRILDKKSLNELERLATALFLTGELGEDAHVEEKVNRIVERHHHVSPMDAFAAVEEIGRLEAEAKAFVAETINPATKILLQARSASEGIPRPSLALRACRGSPHCGGSAFLCCRVNTARTAWVVALPNPTPKPRFDRQDPRNPLVSPEWSDSTRSRRGFPRGGQPVLSPLTSSITSSALPPHGR
jgi:hypothetical protein